MRHPPGSATCLVLAILGLGCWWIPFLGLPITAGALLAARWSVRRTPADQLNGPALIARVIAGFSLILGSLALLLWLALTEDHTAEKPAKAAATATSTPLLW